MYIYTCICIHVSIYLSICIDMYIHIIELRETIFAFFDARRRVQEQILLYRSSSAPGTDSNMYTHLQIYPHKYMHV